MFVRLEQESKACVPMLMTLAGRKMLARLVSP